MLPFWSPTTVRAAKLNRRPPLTTLAQRLMKTTFSSMGGPSPTETGWSRWRMSRRGPRGPSRRGPRLPKGAELGGVGVGAGAGAGVGASVAGVLGEIVSLLIGIGSEYEAALAGGVGEGLDLAVIAGAAAVEDD